MHKLRPRKNCNHISRKLQTIRTAAENCVFLGGLCKGTLSVLPWLPFVGPTGGGEVANMLTGGRIEVGGFFFVCALLLPWRS